MKVAILSDIHGNYAALDAILCSRDFSKIEHLYILGDVVGYYYEAEKVMEKLNQYSMDLIAGNHELFLREDRKITLDHVREKYGKGIEVALKELSHRHLSQLLQAPEKKTVVHQNVNSLLCHGSPWKVDEYIYPDAPIEKLIQCANAAKQLSCDFLFLGHTHYPFIFSHQGCVVANPGSVGQARDTGGLACWQQLDTETGVLIQKRTPYDVKLLQENIQQHDPHHPYLSKILERQ